MLFDLRQMSPLPADLESAKDEILYLRRKLHEEQQKIAEFVLKRELDRRSQAGNFEALLAERDRKELQKTQMLDARKLVWALLEDRVGTRTVEGTEITGTVKEALDRAKRLFE